MKKLYISVAFYKYVPAHDYYTYIAQLDTEWLRYMALIYGGFYEQFVVSPKFIADHGAPYYAFEEIRDEIMSPGRASRLRPLTILILPKTVYTDDIITHFKRIRDLELDVLDNEPEIGSISSASIFDISEIQNIDADHEGIKYYLNQALFKGVDQLSLLTAEHDFFYTTIVEK